MTLLNTAQMAKKSILGCLKSLAALFIFISYCITLLIFSANFIFMTSSMLTLPNCQVSARSDFSEERYDFSSRNTSLTMENGSFVWDFAENFSKKIHSAKMDRNIL